MRSHRAYRLIWVVSALACSTTALCAAEFVVRVPADTPADARVFISGSDPLLGSWKADGVELKCVEDAFRVDLPLEVGKQVEFKFTLGSWDTVEKRADGTDRDNRIVTIESAMQQIEATVERWSSGPAAIEPSIVGTLKLHTIQSAALGKQRTIRIWLPPGYDSSPEQRYPVLYMHDGQNCFDRATSAFGNEWQIDETLTTLIEEDNVPPIIVVGVDNGGGDRIAEYTFVADPKHGGGRGEQHMKFLLGEVLPLINRTFRTQVGRENTFIGGSSLGGVISLELGRRRPDVFGGVLAMSPALWWSGGALVEELKRDPSRLEETRLWIDTGTREGDEEGAARNVELVRAVDAALSEHHIAHHAEIVDGAQHNEPAWAARFGEAVQYLLNSK